MCHAQQAEIKQTQEMLSEEHGAFRPQQSTIEQILDIPFFWSKNKWNTRKLYIVTLSTRTRHLVIHVWHNRFRRVLKEHNIDRQLIVIKSLHDK